MHHYICIFVVVVLLHYRIIIDPNENYKLKIKISGAIKNLGGQLCLIVIKICILMYKNIMLFYYFLYIYTFSVKIN